MKVLVAHPDVLITPEKLDHILAPGLRLYMTRDQRAAARGALMDAAGLCDAMADELVNQNRKGSWPPPRLVLQVAAVMKRCGDEIMRMRDRVDVPK